MRLLETYFNFKLTFILFVQWLEDLGTVSTVDQPAPASNFTKLPKSIVEEIGEIALYVTHYVAFDNILGKLLKKMGLKLGDAAKE